MINVLSILCSDLQSVLG